MKVYQSNTKKNTIYFITQKVDIRKLSSAKKQLSMKKQSTVESITEPDELPEVQCEMFELFPPSPQEKDPLMCTRISDFESVADDFEKIDSFKEKISLKK